MMDFNILSILLIHMVPHECQISVQQNAARSAALWTRWTSSQNVFARLSRHDSAVQPLDFPVRSQLVTRIMWSRIWAHQRASTADRTAVLQESWRQRRWIAGEGRKGGH